MGIDNGIGSETMGAFARHSSCVISHAGQDLLEREQEGVASQEV